MLNEFYIFLKRNQRKRCWYHQPDLEKYIGSNEDWDLSEKILKDICNELDLNAKVCEGEAALYGPKLDFMFKDAIRKRNSNSNNTT